MSFRRYTAAFIAMTVVATGAATHFVEYSYQKRGKIMTTQNYVADSFKEKRTGKDGIAPEVLQAEIDKMLFEAKQRGNDFEMVRIERPSVDDNKPKRLDQFQDQ